MLQNKQTNKINRFKNEFFRTFNNIKAIEILIYQKRVLFHFDFGPYYTKLLEDYQDSLIY